MEPSTPPADPPVWWPPRDPLISRTPPATTPSPRRRHTAHDVRRIGGYAALASSAAIIGYMATASAEKPASQAVIVTVTSPQPVDVATVPTTTVPTTTVPTTTVPTPTVPVVTVPATTATTAVPATTTPATSTPVVTQPTRTRQAPSQGQSNSSTHGS